ncbi:MAG TPA: peptide chain release factor N(5)-glutamine methyltransferase [Terracidiphilus sp.]|jgi:release factor glutamine methyltransferase|nr:peptide chain release factor N(5)-glutamine methyltransferase [Terracidiphilus sp.]
MTLTEWLERGAAQLGGGPHAEKARRDAELLLLYAAGISRSAFLAHSNDELELAAAIHYEVLLERRREGEPIQYIAGECEFYGLSFRVTPDVLIPRPETEHLVESILGLAPVFAEPRIVDVGTGAGSIAVVLAHKLPGSHVAAIDVSETALDLARENAKRNGVAKRIRFLQGDLLAPAAGETFDFVVSNPPYVPSADRETLALEVREYEPGLALFAGEDGLEIHRRLIPDAFGVLASGGFIALEMGCGQSEAVGSLLAGAGFVEVRFAPDLQGIPRVAVARRP